MIPLEKANEKVARLPGKYRFLYFYFDVSKYFRFDCYFCPGQNRFHGLFTPAPATLFNTIKSAVEIAETTAKTESLIDYLVKGGLPQSYHGRTVELLASVSTKEFISWLVVRRNGWSSSNRSITSDWEKFGEALAELDVLISKRAQANGNVAISTES